MMPERRRRLAHVAWFTRIRVARASCVHLPRSRRRGSDPEAATRRALEAFEVLRRIYSGGNDGKILGFLARTFAQVGDRERAVELYAQAMQTLEERWNPWLALTAGVAAAEDGRGRPLSPAVPLR